MICETCNTEMNQKDFVSKTIFYCSNCHGYKITELACNHDFMLILFELSNGAFQLREFCKLCYYRNPKPLKQANCDLTTTPRKTEASYQDFYNNLTLSETEDIRTFLIPFRKELSSDFCKRYTDYMDSDEWKKMRSKILQRDFEKCQICGKKAEQVHHLTYVHLKNEYHFELVSLCAECHKKEYHS
jgi:5-methylcytosine-specific restriction endonuclease McrA